MNLFSKLSTVLFFVLSLSGCEFLNKVSVGSSAQAYGEAWNSGNVDAILDLHKDQSSFQLHFLDEPIAQGKDEIRAAFEKVFTIAPDYKGEVQEVLFGSDYVTIRFVLSATPTERFVLGNMEFTPTGKTYNIEMIDTILFENGLVKTKHTYLDAQSVFQNSASYKTKI